MTNYPTEEETIMMKDFSREVILKYKMFFEEDEPSDSLKEMKLNELQNEINSYLPLSSNRRRYLEYYTLTRMKDILDKLQIQIASRK